MHDCDPVPVLLSRRRLSGEEQTARVCDMRSASCPTRSIHGTRICFKPTYTHPATESEPGRNVGEWVVPPHRLPAPGDLGTSTQTSSSFWARSPACGLTATASVLQLQATAKVLPDTVLISMWAHGFRWCVCVACHPIECPSVDTHVLQNMLHMPQSAMQCRIAAVLDAVGW